MFNLDGLRDWQKEAIGFFKDTANKSPLFNVCPGGGKTRFSSRLMRGILDSGSGRPFFVIVVPTKHLQKQWRDSLLQADGINISTKIKKGSCGRPDKCNGMVVTYSGLHTVLEKIKTWKKLGWQIYGVFDEIHHASEDATWGTAVAALGAMSERGVLLSGTPFRSDGGKIPMVEYDESGLSVGYTYSYKQAVADRVCRRIEFVPYGAEIINERYMPSGEIIKEELCWRPDLEVNDEARIIRLGLDAGQQTIREMLALAREKLSIIQKADKSAASILHCLGGYNDNGFQSDSVDDRFLVKVHQLAGVAGFTSRMVSSQDRESSALIKKFSVSHIEDCLSSIKQVSEGVDILRARLGVYLTNITTEMYFRQVAGRLVRWNPNLDDNQYGLMIYPHVPTLTKYATLIEEEGRVGVSKRKQKEEGVERTGGNTADKSYNIVQMSSGGADGVIHRGDFFSKSDDSLTKAQEIQAAYYPELSVGLIAGILKKADSKNQQSVAAKHVPDDESEMDRLCGKGGEMKRMIQACIEKYPERFEDYNRIYALLNKLQGVPNDVKNKQEWVRNTMGLKGISQRINYLKEILTGVR
jgi:superfamily II DNA or RNA helicase